MKTPVYIASNETDAHLTKGYLENHGIKVVIAAGNDTLGISAASRSVHASYGIYVSDVDFEKAQQVLAERDSHHSSSQK